LSSQQTPFLLLALGNDLLCDDGVALAAAREIRKDFPTESVDIIETSEAGLVLMERMSGFKKALLIDSIQTGKNEPGTIMEFGPADFKKVIGPSPHYAGIPEVLAMAERLKIPFPEEIRILGMEVENPYEFIEEFTPKVKAALPELIKRTKEILDSWTHT